jgi:hypothetical protein
MTAVTRALACGEITPGEAATIAAVYETFVRTGGTAKEKVARRNLLQILTAADDVDEDEDIGDAEVGEDCNRRDAGPHGNRRRALIQPGGNILL